MEILKIEHGTKFSKQNWKPEFKGTHFKTATQNFGKVEFTIYYIEIESEDEDIQNKLANTILNRGAGEFFGELRPLSELN